MMKIYLVTLSLLASCSSYATNYYLSNAGNDANSGTSESDPWQTISQLNTNTLQPGDSVFFEAGDIFRGEIIVTSGGNDAAKIYFGKYGAGNLPIISGAEVVSGWSNYAGNIYQATFTQTPAHLFANDKQMTIARYPNSGFLIHQKGIGNTGFIDSFLTQPNGYWNGATVCMRTSSRVWAVRTVSSFLNDTILLSSGTSDSIYGGYGYYLDNLFPLVDTAGEWFCDAINQTLYFIAPGNVDPSSLFTEASVYDDGILIQNGSGNIVIENIQFEKQRNSGIFIEAYSSNITINTSLFRLQGENGIRIPNGIGHSAISGNNFSDINGISISLGYSHGVDIVQNVMRRIGLIPGYGFSLSPNNMMVIDCISSDSMNVSQNNLDSIGSVGIYAGMTNSLISKNIFNHCLMNINYFGSIHLPPESKCDIEDNIILNTIGNTETLSSFEPLNVAGIFLESSGNHMVQHNTIAFAYTGVLLGGGSSNNFLQGNLIYGCIESQMKFAEGGIQGSTSNNVVTGNIFYAIHEDQDDIRLESPFEEFVPAFFDSNYYFNPYNFFAFRKIILTSIVGTNFMYTLREWQKETSQDQASKSTYFFRNRFSMIDSIAPNLVVNGQFTNNTDTWNLSVDSNAIMLLDNSTPLDFGCLKLVKENAIPYPEGGVYGPAFNIDSGAYYRVGLSNYSIRESNVRLYLSSYDPPFANIGFTRYFPFFNYREDYETIFQAPQSNPHARMEILLMYTDSIVWVDNISLVPVTASYHDPKKESRLFYNTSGSSITFDLADSLFFDLDSNAVINQLTLAPYSSAVLIFDSALILNVNPQPDLRKSIQVFPNPVVRGSKIFIHFDESLHDETHLLLIDMTGKIWCDNKIRNPSSNFEFPISQKIPAGFYLLEINSGGYRYYVKLSVD